MDSVKTKSKELPWIPFKEIPPIFKSMYSVMLCLNQIAEYAVRETGSYEQCCEYWFNTELLRLTEKNETS